MRFALLVAGATAVLVAGMAALVAVVWSDLERRDRDVVGPILEDELGLVLVAGLLFVTLLAFAVAAVLGRYAGAARRLAADAELAAEANPAHRAQPRGAAELRRSAAAVNRLADRHEEAHRETERAVARGRQEIEEERRLLAALLAQLASAVVVCNLDGRILLYNQAARELLGGDEGLVGLGRSLLAILDRDVVAHALDRLLAPGAEGPRARFVAPAGGRLLRVEMAPVRDRDEATTGFLLSAEDITGPAQRGERREALLRGLIEESRAAVGSIRAAVESMVEYGDLEEAQRRRFLDIVRAETLRLGARLEDVMGDAPDGAAQGWGLDEMRAGDLLEALARRLRGGDGPAVEVVPADRDLWVGVNSHALGLALTEAVATLRRADRGVRRVRLALVPDGGHGRLEVRWTGRHLNVENLRAWEGRFRDVLAGHGGEAWSRAEPGGVAILCLLLPVAEPTEPPPPRPVPAIAARPPHYDFALLGRSERTELDERPLGELRCTVLDCEMTGLDTEHDELVSVGAVRVVIGRVLAGEVFERLIDPGRAVPEAAVRVHGITDAMLAGKPGVEEVLPRFARFAEDTVLVGHDVAFDLRFLQRAEPAAGVRFDQPVLDTLLLDAAAHPDHEDHALEAIAERLGVSVVGRHTALGDALVTAEIFVRLLPALRARGVETLGQARAAVRATPEARASERLYG